MRLAKASSCYEADYTPYESGGGANGGTVVVILLVIVVALGVASAAAYGLKTGMLQEKVASLTSGVRARTGPSTSSTVDIGAPPLQSTVRASLAANDSASFATDYTPPSATM